jgi:hypothetical protein
MARRRAISFECAKPIVIVVFPACLSGSAARRGYFRQETAVRAGGSRGCSARTKLRMFARVALHYARNFVMNDNKDDPWALLFTCERCGCWPMAYQGPRPYGSGTSFACARCKQTAVFKIRGAPSRPSAEAVAS